jgi:hypothetical protein
MFQVKQLDFAWSNGGYKKGKKPELFLVLDCETATLPFVGNMELTTEQKQKVSIAKPLIYDLGWKIVDRKLNVYAQHSILIQETFFVPAVFNTAYYREKRPQYMEKYEAEEIVAMTWNEAIKLLQEELQYTKYCTAYNAMFDFKKAIPFTESYISHLYSANYQSWEDNQRKICNYIAQGGKVENPADFDNMNFRLRGTDYPMLDIWGLACNKLINEDKYKANCVKTGQVSRSGLYFKTSAESTFRFLLNDNDFVESHTAFEDVEIECEILIKAVKKGKLAEGIQYFPFRELGTTFDYIFDRKRKNGKPYHSAEEIDNIIEIMYARWEEYEQTTGFSNQLGSYIYQLEAFKQQHFKQINKSRFAKTYCTMLEQQIARKFKYSENLVKGGDSWCRVISEISELQEQLKHFEEYK